MNIALSLRCDYALFLVSQKCDLGHPHSLEWFTLEEVELEAYFLGQHAKENDSVPVYFHGTPLEKSWNLGHAMRVELMVEEFEQTQGTKAEWDALSDEEKSDQLDRFHELCEQGVADEMYFYRIMMDKHLEGYVGH